MGKKITKLHQRSFKPAYNEGYYDHLKISTKNMKPTSLNNWLCLKFSTNFKHKNLILQQWEQKTVKIVEFWFAISWKQ